MSLSAVQEDQLRSERRTAETVAQLSTWEDSYRCPQVAVTSAEQD